MRKWVSKWESEDLQDLVEVCMHDGIIHIFVPRYVKRVSVVDFRGETIKELEDIEES